VTTSAPAPPAENAQLKRTASRGVSLKISEEGGVSVYGLGRFPVTLYKEQWTKLRDMADDIRALYYCSCLPADCSRVAQDGPSSRAVTSGARSAMCPSPAACARSSADP